jgi:hypothetical protein
MSEHEQLMKLIAELNYSMRSLTNEIRTLRIKLDNQEKKVSKNHNSQQRWMAPDGHITSGHKCRMYCESNGLDYDLAYRIL